MLSKIKLIIILGVFYMGHESIIASNATQNVLSSGIFQEYQNISIKPQDDFFDFVNGKWIQNEPIPMDKTSIGTFYDLRDKARDDIQTIIFDLQKKDQSKLTDEEQQIVDLYQSFMNIKVINALNIEPIKSELHNIDNLTKDQFPKYLGYLSKIGVNSPIATFVSIDDKNPSRYIIRFWQSGLGMPDRDYYFNDSKQYEDLRKSYTAYLTKILKLINIDDSQALAYRIFEIEKLLASNHLTRVENRDTQKLYNLYNKKDLVKLGKFFDFNNFIKAMDIENQESFIVSQPSFIMGFDKIFGELSIDDWKLYLKSALLRSYAPYLSDEISNEHFDFYKKTLQGQQQQLPRDKRGVDFVNVMLGEMIGKLYVKKYFEPEAKQRMINLVDNILKAFEIRFENNSWMSADTKKAALIKLRKFTPKIGYPDKWNTFENLVIKDNDLIGNIQRIYIDEHNRKIAKLAEPIRKWEWAMTPQTVNAYYNPTKNEIVFPAAILQPPFFNINADDAVNYGAIGAVIAHEIGHGFDDQGSKYDGDGKLINWWTDNDLKQFQEKTKVLIEQFNNYKVFDDLNVNGHLTLGENIGDLSGVLIGYNAYILSLKGKDPSIIDSLTGAQRFFIGYAQIWRIKHKDETARNLVTIDPHAPAKYRVLGALSNVDAFYDAFGVKKGDKMYIDPKKRVRLWD